MKRYKSYKPSGISWIAEIPSHWSTVALGHIFEIVAGGDAKPKFYSLEKDDIHKFPVYTNTKEENSIYAYTSIPFFKANSITVTGRGDIGRAFLRTTDFDAIVRLLVLTQKNENIYSPFYVYFINSIQGITSDSAAIGQLSAQQLYPHKSVFPPVEEQKRIVEYLSTKTSLIDAQQSAREKEIRLLEELKQAEIANVVTRGLNPDVPMKDSGIPWIGKIPSHWEVRRNKYLFKEEDEKNLDLSFQLLTFSRKKGIIPFSEVNEKEPSASDLKNYKVIRQGQLLENRMQAWSGMFAKSEIDGCVSPDYSVFSPTSEDVCVDFFAHLFRTNQYIAHWANLSRGVGNGFNRLYTNQFHSVYALFPPIEEQRAIVEFIEQKNKAIDDMIANLRAEIDFLTEYKQRLIADAVTGQIKID